MGGVVDGLSWALVGQESRGWRAMCGCSSSSSSRSSSSSNNNNAPGVPCPAPTSRHTRPPTLRARATHCCGTGPHLHGACVSASGPDVRTRIAPLAGSRGNGSHQMSPRSDPQRPCSHQTWARQRPGPRGREDKCRPAAARAASVARIRTKPSSPSSLAGCANHGANSAFFVFFVCRPPLGPRRGARGVLLRLGPS